MVAIAKHGRNTKDENANRRLALCKSLLMGHDIFASSTDAGYSEGARGLLAQLTDPELERMVREGVVARMNIRVAPLAAKLLENILNDDTMPIRLRFDAAKTALDRAGYIPPKAPDAPGQQGKSMAEQSPTQLREFINQAQNELANRAPVVEGTATVAPDIAPEHDADAAGLLD